MTIYFGADHRGFALKEQLKSMVRDMGYEVFDVGAGAYNENDDFPPFAAAVAKAVGEDPKLREGILVCGSGIGVDIVANRMPGVRAALAMSPDHIYAGRHDDDVNVLALAADFIEAPVAEQITKVFLSTPFSGEERHKRRVGMMG